MTRPVVVPIAIALLLAGCASPAEPSASPEPEPTSASPSPDPTEEPAAAQDPADPATWIIDAGGVGPYRLGMPLDAAIAASPLYGRVESGCLNDFVAFLGPAGATAADSPVLLGADVHSELVAVAVSTPLPATEAGARVGATVAEVTAAHPTATESLRYASIPQYTVESATGWITFQQSGDLADDTAPIDLISVVAGATPPDEFCG